MTYLENSHFPTSSASLVSLNSGNHWRSLCTQGLLDQLALRSQVVQTSLPCSFGPQLCFKNRCSPAQPPADFHPSTLSYSQSSGERAWGGKGSDKGAEDPQRRKREKTNWQKNTNKIRFEVKKGQKRTEERKCGEKRGRVVTIYMM